MSTGILLEGVLRGIFQILKFKFQRLIWFLYSLHDNDVKVDSNAKQMSQVLQKYTHSLWDRAVSYNMFMCFCVQTMNGFNGNKYRQKQKYTHEDYVLKAAPLHIVNSGEPFNGALKTGGHKFLPFQVGFNFSAFNNLKTLKQLHWNKCSWPTFCLPHRWL